MTLPRVHQVRDSNNNVTHTAASIQPTETIGIHSSGCARCSPRPGNQIGCHSTPVLIVSPEFYENHVLWTGKERRVEQNAAENDYFEILPEAIERTLSYVHDKVQRQFGSLTIYCSTKMVVSCHGSSSPFLGSFPIPSCQRTPLFT